MSRQRLPVGKECRCPAELILARRKKKMWKAREREREEMKRWQRKVPGFFFGRQKWKRIALEKREKNPLPIHQFHSNFHLLSLHCSGVFSLPLVVQLVSVQLSRHLELMRQLYYFRGEVL